MTDELTVPEPAPDEIHLMVVASNREQMQAAQQQLIGWIQGRYGRIQEEKAEAEASLASAKKHKWKSSPFQARVTQLAHQLEFYIKLETAIAAGYTIVPNFDNLDVFAIRTCKRKPDTNYVKQTNNWGRPIPNDQESESPELGEGRFVNATAEYDQNRLTSKNDKGETVVEWNAFATAYKDVDFPFKLVTPQILDETKRAMDLLCFDDMGVVPRRRRARRGDPMVIGRIHVGPKRHKKTISFLVTWFIDTRMI